MSRPLPNLHHLELFHHVARAGGITAAARTMPYGIQQPAISGQIAQLERDLGVRLFQRRPFRLTPEGEELHGFVSPFFSALPEVADRIAGRAARHLRVAAPSMVVREHLPRVLAGLRRRHPELELTLVESDQRRSLRLLEAEEVSLAIAELEGRPPAGTKSEVLIRMPLVLLLPPGMKAPARGLRALPGRVPLVRPSSDTTMARLFRKGLVRRGLEWPASIEVNELETVHEFVARGFGAGLSVQAPGLRFPAKVAVMPLKGFPQLTLAALWRGQRGPLVDAVIRGLAARVPGAA